MSQKKQSVKKFCACKMAKSALGLHLNEIYQIIWATNIT